MKRTITYLILAALTAACVTVAQPNRKLNQNAVDNLLSAISSDNMGLKKSAMFFAGYYKIDGAVEALRNEMNVNPDPNVKILAALSLFEIGDESVINDLLDLAMDGKENIRIRKMAKAIYDYWVTNSYTYVKTVD